MKTDEFTERKARDCKKVNCIKLKTNGTAKKHKNSS